VALTNGDGRSAKTIAGKDPSNTRSLAQPKDGEVTAIGFTNTSLCHADFNTSDWIDLVVCGDVQVNGHDSHSFGYWGEAVYYRCFA